MHALAIMLIIFYILTLIMIGLCNLEILQMLIDFRKSDSNDIPTDLVPLLLNLSTNLDLKALDKLLFYEKEIHFYKEENKRKKVYLQIVKDKMSWQSHNKLQLVINDMSIYSTNINTFFQSFTTGKKRLSVLDFCKKVDTQENKVMNVRFQPVKNETVIKKQFLQKIDGVQVFKRFTFRCNKNIVNPCRLTFIKFHDQLKPPIYYHYEKDGNRNSLKKLDIDYDFDSDAEWILEDGESVNSETRSVDDSEMTEEWIDEDSVVVEKNVKTEIEYIDMPFKIYKTIGNEFSLSLLKSDIVKEELIDELKKRLETGVKENVIKMFGYEYRIKNSVVSKKVKEILAQEK